MNIIANGSMRRVNNLLKVNHIAHLLTDNEWLDRSSESIQMASVKMHHTVQDNISRMPSAFIFFCFYSPY